MLGVEGSSSELDHSGEVQLENPRCADRFALDLLPQPRLQIRTKNWEILTSDSPVMERVVGAEWGSPCVCKPRWRRKRDVELQWMCEWRGAHQSWTTSVETLEDAIPLTTLKLDALITVTGDTRTEGMKKMLTGAGPLQWNSRRGRRRSSTFEEAINIVRSFNRERGYCGEEVAKKKSRSGKT